MTELDCVGDPPWHFHLLAASSSPEQDINGLKFSTKVRKKGKALESFSQVQCKWELFKLGFFCSKGTI